MKHLKLFEEFNPYTGKQLADKLRMFAQASDVVTGVSEVKQVGKDFVFEISTHLKRDGEGDGEKSFRVYIPFSQIEKARVVTIAKGKKEFSTNIEIKDENDLQVILMNFFEATGIFDDNVIDEIVYNASKLKNVQQVKTLLKTLV